MRDFFSLWAVIIRCRYFASFSILKTSALPVYNPVWNETPREYMTFPVLHHSNKISDTPYGPEIGIPYFS